MVTYDGDGGDLEESEGIGHEEEPAGDEWVAAREEVAEDAALGKVAEGPVAGGGDGEEGGDDHRVAEAEPLEHLPHHRRRRCGLEQRGRILGLEKVSGKWSLGFQDLDLGDDPVAVGGGDDGEGVEHPKGAVLAAAGEGVVLGRRAGGVTCTRRRRHRRSDPSPMALLQLYEICTCVDGTGGGADAVGEAEEDGGEVDVAEGVEGRYLREHEHEDGEYRHERVELQRRRRWPLAVAGEGEDVYRLPISK